MSKEPEQGLLVQEGWKPEAIQPSDRWERLLQIAVERGGGAEQFAMLVDSITKARREDARLQFEAALGRFKEHLPQVFKTRKIAYPNKDGSLTEYSHAELEVASEVCGEELRREGIIHNWRSSEGVNGRTLMTCVFRHPTSGHVEEMATLGAPPDTSGGKNNVQAVGSTTTYLQRYTLLQACGVVPKGLDNDARSVEGMPENSITDYCIAMQDSTNITALQTTFKECYQKANKLQDKTARGRFIKVYEERKKALQAVAK
jgi:hypothetical protein